MEFSRPLVRARFLGREKRFLIHAELPDGSRTIAHTNNTGRMTGCLSEGCTIWLSPADNPRRKLAWTLELSETAGSVLVGVNTALANRLTAEGLAAGLFPELSGFRDIRAEVTYGSRGSRADFLLTGNHGNDRRSCWVEVKNVSLVHEGHARFPDAPSARARKHLLELMESVQNGDRAALIFCVQRNDARTVGPADDIDPEYGRLLRLAMAQGVEVFGLACRVRPEGIAPEVLLPLAI